MSSPPPSPSPSSKPKPLFIYGTLRAPPLLAWALTGDASNTAAILPLIRPGRVHGYACFALLEGEHPAVIPASSCPGAAPSQTDEGKEKYVEGYLLRVQTDAQREKLREFEGESCEVVSVRVRLSPSHVPAEGEDGDGEGVEDGEVDADMYIWTGDLAALSARDWDYDVFEREVLGSWLEMSGGVGGGMGMVR